MADDIKEALARIERKLDTLIQALAEEEKPLEDLEGNHQVGQRDQRESLG